MTIEKVNLGTTVKTIAGHEFALIAGHQYRASRPFNERGRKVYPVTITDLSAGGVADRVLGLSFEEANELVNAFNNGVSSFEGRVW